MVVSPKNTTTPTSTLKMYDMTKFWKVFKKIFIATVIFGQIFNPLIMAAAVAAEEGATTSGELVTGDAVSISVTDTQVNTTEINSQIDTSLTTIATSSSEAVTPFAIPSPSPETSVATPSPTIQIESVEQKLEIENEAVVETTSEATTTTGDNVQTSTDEATMTTGDSVAIASTTTLVNTTLIDSILEIGVIAILSEWDGDIVLDPMTEMPIGNYDSLLQSLDLTNSNTTVKSAATATADTGNNTQIGPETTLTTGDSMAIAESNVMVNTTYINTDIFTLLAENLWLWNGSIRNWQYPGSVSSSGLISNASSQNSTGCGNSCSMDLSISNQAQVTTSTTAMASTGGNQQTVEGEANMMTGDAKALAISSTMVNTTLINARYRQLSLALFAPWTGDLVFAYPDLALSAEGPAQVLEGEDVTYKVIIKNNGYAAASNINLDTTISDPNQVVYEKKDTLITLGSGDTEIISMTIPSTGRGGQILSLTTSVKNETPEESMTNNNAVLNTEILRRENTTSTTTNSDEPKETPKLRLTSQNNINEFVYPGDSVTYDMIAYNDGPIEAHNVVLTQKFYNPQGQELGEFRGNIGSISVNAKKNIHFILATGAALPGGSYYTRSVLYGEAENGQGTESNTVENDVRLNARIMSQKTTNNPVESVMAVSSEEEQVLGVSNMQTCTKCQSIPWYIAISLGSLAYYFMCARRRDFAQAIKWGLALPLSAYAGLIFSNPDCVSSINFLPSSGTFCIWFLPLAMGIYLAVMVVGRRIAVTTSLLVSKNPVQV